MLEWWGPVIYEYYAASEGGGTLVTPEEWLRYPGTVGRAWPSSEIRIYDDAGTACAVDAPGTVYMALGAADFKYHKDDGKTAANRRDGFFTVGDIGYLNAEGYLFLCDRKIDMIISGGVNIYPTEVESQLPDPSEDRRRRRVRHPSRRLGRRGEGLWSSRRLA
jgi:long-chain acyl-CoA synthetase